MPDYTIAIIQLDDIPGISATDTVGTSMEGNTYTVSGVATPILITVDDDDLNFEDAFIETGGSQLIAEPVTVNGTAYGPATPGGTPQDVIELEFAFTTSTGETYYIVRIDGVNVGLTGATLPAAGSSFSVPIGGSSDGQATPWDGLACFVSGTLIDTPDGPRPVEELSEGDLVNTIDNGPLPIRRAARTTLSVADLMASPHLRPICLGPGVLGNEAELRVSPQHRVLRGNWKTQLYFGEDEALVPAKALLGSKGVSVAPLTGPVTYHHLLFDAHQLITSNGAVTESLYPDAAAARSHAAGIEELRELMPELETELAANGGAVPKSARPLLRRKEGALLRD